MNMKKNMENTMNNNNTKNNNIKNYMKKNKKEGVKREEKNEEKKAIKISFLLSQTGGDNPYISFSQKRCITNSHYLYQPTQIYPYLR